MRVLLEVVAVLLALVAMSALLVFGAACFVAEKYLVGTLALVLFLAAVASFRRVARKLDHWAKPMRFRGILPPRYVPWFFALILLCMSVWPLYWAGSGLVKGEIWTTNRVLSNFTASALRDPFAFWFTVAKLTYLGLTMLYGVVWALRQRRHLIEIVHRDRATPPFGH